MFIHTLESLEEFEDYIEQLEETVGLSSKAYKEVKQAISKERDKLKNLSLSGVVKQSELLHKCDVDKIGNEYRCLICGKKSEPKF